MPAPCPRAPPLPLPDPTLSLHQGKKAANLRLLESLVEGVQVSQKGRAFLLQVVDLLLQQPETSVFAPVDKR